MKCHYCGAEISEGQNYCLWCGTRQELPEPAEQPVPVAQPETVMQPEPVWEEPAALPEIPPMKPAVPVMEREIVPPVKRTPPKIQLATRRSLGKMIFLGILTLGIYPMVIYSRIVSELDIAASRYDGKRTMPFFAMLILAPVTLGIYGFVWMHKFCRRIGDELKRRNLDYKFGPGTFWLWGILGSFILVGPFVFLHKMMKSMNKINEDFNCKG